MALELGSHGTMPLDFSSGAREGISGSQPGSPPGSSAFTIVTPKVVTDRNDSSPLHFPSAQYCRMLWGSHLLPAGPRYLSSIALPGADSSEDKSVLQSTSQRSTTSTLSRNFRASNDIFSFLNQKDRNFSFCATINEPREHHESKDIKRQHQRR
ncbi:uncharacterized protein LOC123310879 [Coccinella septempunctata]|uniref:uncharacterized protein LOC123310879 n=1 Tax=Coccinella septempunctata TaxID=41139 RepID=UPI001D06FEFA|nr:uncharacterized protein LOC123310879 [Coccinella septempunctata]